MDKFTIKRNSVSPEQAQKIADILCEIFNRYSGLDVEIKLVNPE